LIYFFNAFSLIVEQQWTVMTMIMKKMPQAQHDQQISLLANETNVRLFELTFFYSIVLLF